MRVANWYRVAGLAAFLAAATPAMAQTCAGFTDVPDDGAGPSAFCPGVQWIKNRSITSGCTGTTYCPNNPVTRIQMAAFLYRMGKVVTPEDLGPAAFTSAGRHDISTSPILCQTADYQVPPSTSPLSYPRRAMFNSKVNVWDPSSDVELVVDVMYSTQLGAPGTWTSITGSQTFQTLRAGGAVVDDVSMYPIGFTDLNVGTTYRFGIRIARVSPGGGTGNPNIYCENRVSITNRNGTLPPFDETPRSGRAAQLPGQ